MGITVPYKVSGSFAKMSVQGVLAMCWEHRWYSWEVGGEVDSVFANT